MKKFFKILISLIVLIILVLAGGMFYITNGLEAGKNVEINGLNITNINDGIYNGKYKAGRWSNELKVTVKDKKITNIEIVDDVTFAMANVRNELFNKVIKEQNTKVVTVSGATVTSKAYLKSIENAFTNK